jgi:hypothetical protein
VQRIATAVEREAANVAAVSHCDSARSQALDRAKLRIRLQRSSHQTSVI